MKSMVKEKKTPTKEDKKLFSNKEYESTLADLKKHIRDSQLKAVKAANGELIKLYWAIGKIIVEKQENSGWGTKIIEKLTKDIQNEFPGIEGFSRTNIFRMRAFYTAYRNHPPAGGLFHESPPDILLNIPWRHNSLLVEKIKSHEERIWYAQKIIELAGAAACSQFGLKMLFITEKGKRSPISRPHCPLHSPIWPNRH